MLGVLVLALGIAACGSTAGTTTSRASRPRRAYTYPSPPPQVVSGICSSSGSSLHPHGVTSSCTYLLSDGRRFRCSGSAFEHSSPSPSTLEHATGCAHLTPIVIPPATRAVIAAIDTARTCMTKKGLRAFGGPVFPEQSPSSPDGELIVGNGHGGAFIAFYTTVSRAERLEPEVRQNASRVRGAELERRGAVTALFIRRPANRLRRAVLACAFS